MTQETYNNYQQAAKNGTIADDQNLIFIFSQTKSDLLLDLINGKIDARQLARIEMANRGLSVIDGTWVGFQKAKEILNQTL